jgi:DNA-directed RNA polymerase specialized sigma24 family protein
LRQVIGTKQWKDKMFNAPSDYFYPVAESFDVEKIYKKCVDEMPDKIKSTFLLSRSKRYSNDEIAQIQGISVKTVEKRITFY